MMKNQFSFAKLDVRKLDKIYPLKHLYADVQNHERIKICVLEMLKYVIMYVKNTINNSQWSKK